MQLQPHIVDSEREANDPDFDEGEDEEAVSTGPGIPFAQESTTVPPDVGESHNKRHDAETHGGALARDTEFFLDKRHRWGGQRYR